MSRILLHSSNASGHLIDANTTWLERLGYTRDEAIGLHRSDYCTKKDAKRLEGFLFPTAVAQGEVNDIPMDLLSKTGEVLPVLITAKIVYTPDGEVSHSIVASEPVDWSLHQEMQELRTQLDAARKLIAANVRAASDLLATLKP